MNDDLFLDRAKTATFSPCRRYRYDLWRRWSPGPYALFIGLNPSTADHEKDDPTIRRCIRFARDWGYGSLCMTNLFAFRATDPEMMKAEDDPIGPENDSVIQSSAKYAGVVIAAWGVHGVHEKRDLAVREQIFSANILLHCLGLSKDGHPRHPLYMRADCNPIPYSSP